jgi:hypothetical protein
VAEHRLGITIRIEQGLGEGRHFLESSLIGNRLGESDHGSGSPGRLEAVRLEWIANQIVQGSAERLSLGLGFLVFQSLEFLREVFLGFADRFEGGRIPDSNILAASIGGIVPASLEIQSRGGGQIRCPPKLGGLDDSRPDLGEQVCSWGLRHNGQHDLSGGFGGLTRLVDGGDGLMTRGLIVDHGRDWGRVVVLEIGGVRLRMRGADNLPLGVPGLFDDLGGGLLQLANHRGFERLAAGPFDGVEGSSERPLRKGLGGSAGHGTREQVPASRSKPLSHPAEHGFGLGSAEPIRFGHRQVQSW